MSPSIRRGALATTCLALTACAGATSGAAARPGDRTATGPAAAAAQVSSSQVTAAHLRITVTTTSDWTQLRLHGVTIEAQRLSHAGGGHWSRQPFGPALTNGGGHATVTDDLVVSDPSGRRSFTWTIQKGYAGSTQVRVVNRNGPRPTRAATYTDAVHSRSHSTNPKRVALSRETVMGRHRLTWPRADTRHLVLADFYPWWSTYDDPRLADRPSDPRSTTTLAGVESLTAQAASHGVDGFVVSWDGESGHGAEFRLALRAARDHHQLVTGYLETVEAKQAGHLAATERKWLSQLLTHASNPAFLHASGVPVVFVYEMSLLPPGRWRHILAAVRRRTGSRVRLVGDATDPRYLPVEWGLDRYAATAGAGRLRRFAEATAAEAKAPAVLYPHRAARAFVGTVSPGFNDTRLRGNTHKVVSRDHGRRYLATWRAALAGQPDWILVTSWNEWFEGTSIEPGKRAGAVALAQTKQRSARF